jgi:diaminopimelate epimerase
MEIPFFKYHGTGNDFIMLDNRDGHLRLSADQIVRLCRRNFGIGSDGLILIEQDAAEDFYMNFYNPDASQSFCGNGSRCAVAFARALGMVTNHGMFRAIDGVHAFVVNGDEIAIQMRDVAPVSWEENQCLVQTGSPHFIVEHPSPDELDIVREGRAIRYGERFRQEGVNVNFVRFEGEELWMRTYERGVEAETLSCGTGVTAAALSLASKNTSATRVNVHTRGGDLTVKFERMADGSFTDVWLCGPAEQVFKGTMDV